MLVPGAVDGTLGHTYILWSDGFRPCFDFRTNQKPDSLSTDVLITIRSEIHRPVLSNKRFIDSPAEKKARTLRSSDGRVRKLDCGILVRDY